MNCQEANKICNKAQYNEASLLEKIRLKFHLLFCKYCAKYSNQNTIITKICNEKQKEENLSSMDETVKENLKNKIKKISS